MTQHEQDLLVVCDRLEEHGLEEYAEGFRHPFWRIGKAYYLRCVVYSAVGRLIYLDANELVLETAAYVATDGRYGEAVASGFPDNAEYEVVPKLLINRNAISDATEWNHELPTVSH